jgi:hypothetical protein
VGNRIDLYGTTAVGTGGTPAARDTSPQSAADPAGGAFVRFDESANGPPALHANITARVAPAAGATVKRWLWPGYYQPEETSPAPFQSQLVNLLPIAPTDGLGLPVYEGTGILLKQGAVAGVGSASVIIGFNLRTPW